MVDVIDPAVAIDRDDAFAHGVEGRHGARPRRHRAATASGSISRAVSSNAGSPALSITVLESSTRVTWPWAADQLDFGALGGRVAGETPPQIVFHQLDIFRRDESVNDLPTTSAASMPSIDRKRALANRICLRCTSTASCTVSTSR